MTDPTDDYSSYFDTAGQPVRRGVHLSDSELSDYIAFFPDEQTTTATTKENQ